VNFPPDGLAVVRAPVTEPLTGAGGGAGAQRGRRMVTLDPRQDAPRSSAVGPPSNLTAPGL